MAERTILALAASPRVGGNTDRLLDAFLEAFTDAPFRVEKLYLTKLAIAPCDHCGGCLNTGACAVEDDMGIIYDGLARAAGLVFASPVYFLGVTAQAKAVIDRCQALWVASHRLGRPLSRGPRPGVFISAAGVRSPGVFDCALKTVRAFFGSTSFRLATSVLEAGLDELESLGLPGPVLANARSRGAALRAEMAMALAGA